MCHIICSMPHRRGGHFLVVRCHCGAAVECEHRHANQCPTCAREYNGAGALLEGAALTAVYAEDVLEDFDDDYLDDDEFYAKHPHLLHQQAAA
jgi:hypothetical protein